MLRNDILNRDKMKVYFAGSIRGGRSDAELYGRIISYIKKTDIVLTEHIGSKDIVESFKEPVDGAGGLHTHIELIGIREQEAFQP